MEKTTHWQMSGGWILFKYTNVLFVATGSISEASVAGSQENES